MMLVLLLCVIMKIAELSTGRMSPSLSRQPPPCCKKQRRRYRILGSNGNIKNIYNGIKRTRKGVIMMEDPQTPGSDCNSNPADPISQDLIGSEFIQDNSDYQWFLDYGYRDGSVHVHPSVLSSLSTSYTHDDLGYYDDLARNLDANLAEMDMESFRTADIHTLLTALPVMCTDPVQQSEFNYQRERYASISGSVMEKIDIGSSLSPHTSSQGDDSACSTTDTNSICKSSLLFSPVKETPVLPPGGSYSVDSLDCEDILLTCQTNNKNNYTIAFEGSMTMYSDGSQDFESQEKQKMYEAREALYIAKTDLKNMLNLSMACSDSKIYTTWSNLKHTTTTNKAITRHGSGNNNTIPNFLQVATTELLNPIKKSQSLPDLRENHELEQIKFPLNFSMDSAESHHQHLQSISSAMSRSVNESLSSNTSVGKKMQNLSLVKLFIKQKSMSAEGMSLTLDQSDSASENGWPTSNSDSATNTNTQIQRNGGGESRANIPENDFAINWVKTDCYKSEGTSSQDGNSKRVPSIKEFKEQSPSVEELSESLMKSDTHFDNISIEAKHLKKTWSKSEQCAPMSRTTGTQAITQMEENGVQTSLLYVLPPKNDFSYIRETLIDKKPVYIVYPNYTLPDLSFLKSTDVKLDNIQLKPQQRMNWKKNGRSNRPFSCNDIDALKQRGFSHVKDWESLTFLLPSEYRKVLHDVPEIPDHVKLEEETKKPFFCSSPPLSRTRTMSEFTANNISSSSSTGTQPSSGYRGSSTILSDSSTNQPGGNTNPLYLYRYDSASSENSLTSQDKKMDLRKTGHPGFSKRSLSLPQGERDSENSGKIPPRPPLPRSILRKNRASSTKRYSMFDMGGGIEEIEDRHALESNKRMSLQEPYFINNDIQSHMRHGKIIDSDKDIDEVEERRYAERMKEIDGYGFSDPTDLESSGDDVRQLEEFLKRSGISSNSSDEGEDSDVKLRSYVRKFLALKMNKDLKIPEMHESQRKTVSFAVHQRKQAHLNDKKENKDIQALVESDWKSIDLNEKKDSMNSVSKAVDHLIKYWQSGSRDTYDKNDCSQLCLTHLCPALYAIMFDGLKSQITSSFGPISNSVWQVVEISSQQGPLTNTLNELVQKINTEDFMTEGMLKFHGFIFGLLNLRALDAWFAYLCTRETILRKHYSSNSLFVSALACAKSRELIDNFLSVLQPLKFCPFQLDLFYQYRQLHNSFGNMHGTLIAAVPSPKRVRPRSCNYDDKRGKNEAESSYKKRWSNLTIGSKMYPGLDDSEDYTDSLEHPPSNRSNRKNPRTNSPETKKGEIEGDVIPGEIKFRKLQEKWELMVGKEDQRDQPPTSPNRTQASASASQKSKIPRLLTSPIKQPTSSLTAGKTTKSPVTGIPTLKKPTPTNKLVPKKATDIKAKDVPKRTSRVDQEHAGTVRPHLTRPSSLPYKSHGVTSKEKNLISPQRRAASTSLPRPNTPAATRTNTQTKKPLKEVRTLTQRLPSDNGHLSFNEGDRLKVIFEVDNKWLLCAKGERKGLVPRTCVHPYQT